MKRILIATVVATTSLLPFSAGAEDSGSAAGNAAAEQKPEPVQAKNLEAGDVAAAQNPELGCDSEFGISKAPPRFAWEPIPEASANAAGEQKPEAASTNEFEIGAAAPEQKAPPICTNEIDAGVGGGLLRGQYYKFGRFTGIVDPVFGIGGVTIRGRDPWDSGGTHYWDIEGSDLGLDDRSASINYGQQGSWGIKLYYDGIPNFNSQSFQSIFNKDGTLGSGIAPGSVNNARTLTNKLQNYDVSTQRDIFGGNANYQSGDWSFTAGARHEHKDGLKEDSFLFGSSPVSPSTSNVSSGALMYFPEAVDYDTDRYDATMAYNGADLQVQFGNTFSNFTDNVNAYNVKNPFALTTGYGAGFNPANLSANISAPPSNLADQIKFQLAFNLAPKTRLNVNLGTGVQMQNEAFPPETGNPYATGSFIPRSSFNGLIIPTLGNVALTSEPLPKLNVRASYTIDDRDNLSPRNNYVFNLGDVAAASSQFNLPYSFMHQTAKLEAGYRVLPETKVTLGYTFDDTHRSYADTGDVTENTFLAKVRSAFDDGLSGSLGYSHAIRVASNYNEASPWGYFLPNGSGTSVDFAGLFKYFEASRNRDEVKGTLDAELQRGLMGTLVLKFDNDDYPDSTLGMRSNTNFSIGPDLSYQPTKTTTTHFYYTYQRTFYDQNDIYSTSTSCNSNGSTITPTCNGEWHGKTTDQVHTVGFEGEWEAIPSVFKLTATYNFSYGDTAYSVADGGAFALCGGACPGAANASLVTAPLPDVTSMLNSFTLRGEYKLQKNLTLYMGNTFERFVVEDFAYDYGATQYSTGLLSGDLKPSYTVDIVTAGLRYSF